MILRLHALVCDGAFEVDVKIMEEAFAYQLGVMQLSKFYYCFGASSERWWWPRRRPRYSRCAFVRPPTVMAEVADGDGWGKTAYSLRSQVLTAALLLHAVPSRSGSILGPSILPCGNVNLAACHHAKVKANTVIIAGISKISYAPVPLP